MKVRLMKNLYVKILVMAMLSLVAAVFGVCTGQTAKLPLRSVNDLPLSGRATRFDYQSFDQQSGRLYIAHLGDDMMTVFDTNAERVIGDVKDLKHVHGVLAVPELHRVYASATGTNELAVIDDQALQTVARAPAGEYPDGIAYASKSMKLYVSDLRGKSDTVIDARTNQRIATIALEGGAGNTQYDAASDRIFADDFTFTNPYGEIMTKEQRIAEIKPGGIQFMAYTADDVKVRVYGDTAVVTSRATLKGKRGDRDISGQNRIILVFVNKDGHWQAVASQSTPIAAQTVKPTQ